MKERKKARKKEERKKRKKEGEQIFPSSFFFFLFLSFLFIRCFKGDDNDAEHPATYVVDNVLVAVTKIIDEFL